MHLHPIHIHGRMWYRYVGFLTSRTWFTWKGEVYRRKEKEGCKCTKVLVSSENEKVSLSALHLLPGSPSLIPTLNFWEIRPGNRVGVSKPSTPIMMIW